MLGSFVKYVGGSVSTIVLLTSCAGGSSPAATPLAAQQSQGRAAKHAFQCPPCLYVVNDDGSGYVNSHNSITVYPVGANGNVKPVQWIRGKHTGLSSPQGVAVDASGNIYVANFGGPPRSNPYNLGSITVYSTGANGDVPPIATISGSSTGLDNPVGIALDPVNGDIYVASLTGGYLSGGYISFYAAGSNGNVAPSGTISGSNTHFYLSEPDGLAFDASGNLYVPNFSPTAVLVFAAGANGNVAPTRNITGSHTALENPAQVALDSSANIYVSNEFWPGSLTAYAADANGNASPIGGDAGKRTKLYHPDGIALDASNNRYVANGGKGRNTITVYDASVNGNKKPIATIRGDKTKLYEPQALFIR